MEKLKVIFLFDIFPFLCRLVGVGLFLMGLYGIGFPPKEDIGTASLTLLVLAIFSCFCLWQKDKSWKVSGF
ncbi:hypothetical protein ACFSB1_12380 [Halopseudomonas phragmitis]|uniref:hypothetical protein n=1 Tax=Halopseudomonas phragmitis TaxID=1931241 RepID=UPI001C468D93|nr:hypothetical protein [Halopseudomonas phragmitis]